jgi:predicted transcriptional regulator
MEVLWKRGRATVAEVLEALAKRPRPAFNTVQTTIRILEQKGYVGHEEAGRAFVYFPLRDKASVSRAAVEQLVSRFFDGSAGRLAVNLLSDADLSRDDLARVERLIAEAKRR